ncbi:hypothetical protein BDV19DRAFT_375288 [Aspergillus venezuelensis]
MHSFLGFLTTLASIIGGTAALEASALVFGSGNRGASTTVPGATLPQLLELRSDSSTASTLQNSDQNSVKICERFAGSPYPLFNAPVVNESTNTIMVILEGLSGDIETLNQHEYGTELIRSTFKTAAARNDFADHLLTVRTEGIASAGSRHFSFDTDNNTILNSESFAKTCLSSSPYLDGLSRTLSTGLLRDASAGECWTNEGRGTVTVHLAFKAEAHSTSASENDLHSVISELHSLTLEGKKITMVIISDTIMAQKSAHTRRASEGNKVRDISHRDTELQSIASQQRGNLPLSLAPVCYATNSSCNDATGTCSGHGACYEKSSDCYACSCYETTVKDRGGVERKIRWGGPACQKQDISSAFFLIAGVTLTVMAAIGAAVGMIFRVGTTELPGVISAGVGAVKAQK